MFNKPHSDQLIRGPWSEKCSNCTYFEEGKCTLIDQPVGRQDWCKDYKRQTTCKHAVDVENEYICPDCSDK